jgi:hypothetical protein
LSWGNRPGVIVGSNKYFSMPIRQSMMIKGSGVDKENLDFSFEVKNQGINEEERKIKEGYERRYSIPYIENKLS